MKFFVTNVSGSKSLAVVTKMSILVHISVLDLPLLETEIRKLNKHLISGRDFTKKIFCSSLDEHKKKTKILEMI